ncbi:lantibiotic dehydratase [Sphingobacterium sp. WOUb80]|uniref:lantibiotic dehydratase n=1 Tax=Sphingobacterium sp. WOUb80 TaxID=3234028 RepID=UPI003CEE0A33
MFEPANYFLIRLPRFPLNNLLELNEAIDKKDITLIKGILNDTGFLQAISLASRSFLKIGVDWLNDADTAYESNDRVLSTFYRYYTRMCSRATPFGAFAGFALGDIVERKQNQLLFSDINWQSNVRVDMEAFFMIRNSIIESLVRNESKFFPNSTIYRTGDHLRYFEQDKYGRCTLEQVGYSDILLLLIQKSDQGLSMKQLSEIIANEFGDVDTDEINCFIGSLITNGIFIERLPPFLGSAKDSMDSLIEVLEMNHNGTGPLDRLRSLRTELKSGLPIENVEEISRKYSDFISDDGQLFQLDLEAKPKSAEFSKQIVRTLIKRVEDLSRLSPSGKIANLESFRIRFVEKYGEKEVPLLVALDPHDGIGYGHQTSGNIELLPLLKDLHFSHEQVSGGKPVPELIRTVLDKYLDHFQTQEPISLTRDDVEKASYPEAPQFSSDYFIFGELLADSIADLDEGNYRFHTKADLPSPYVSNLMSRYAVHSGELLENIKAHTTQNNHDGSVFAEVLYLPNNRSANILLRPRFYNYEIECMASGGNDNDSIRINLNDLYISVVKDKVMLRSKDQNIFISPRISSSYNSDKSDLAAIRFFGDIQYQDLHKGYRWDWSILNSCPFLPRIEYRELILSEARWLLKKDQSIGRHQLKELLAKANVPRYCVIKEYDNVLLLDLQNDVSLEIIFKRLRDTNVYIFESFHNNAIQSSDGLKYCSEVAFPVRSTKAEAEVKVVDRDEPENIKRLFQIGEEWSYFKIYCNAGLADEILTGVLQEFIDLCKDRYQLESWYFIRYEDPLHHLRVRLKMAHSKNMLDDFNAQLAYYISAGSVRIQMEPYERELERYGSQLIEFSEQLFFHNSVYTSAVIKCMAEEGREDQNWQYGIVMADRLLDGFCLNVSEKAAIVNTLFVQMLPEFIIIDDPELRKKFMYSIDRKLRDNKEILDGLLRRKDYSSISQLSQINKYCLGIKGPVSEILEVTKGKDITYFLQCHMHMNLNRLFFTKSRRQELVIYYFLYKTYHSIAKRNDSK